MNHNENSKLTRVVSTKITDEEFNFFMRLARQYQSQGYVVKANPSEIVRLILRTFRQFLLSHKNDQFLLSLKNTNSAMTSVGSSSSMNTSQRPSHGTSTPRGNKSSIGSAQQSSDILGNNDEIIANDTTIGNSNKSLAQNVSSDRRRGI